MPDNSASQRANEDIRVYRVRLKHYVPEILDLHVVAVSEVDAEKTTMQWLSEGELRDDWEIRKDLADTEVDEVEETTLPPNLWDYASSVAAEELMERFRKEIEASK